MYLIAFHFEFLCYIGNELVKRWRSAKQNICETKIVNNIDNSVSYNNKLKTKIDCYFIQQTRHHGTGDQLCVYNNVIVNMGLFNQDSLTKSIVEKYVKTNHNEQPYLPFPQDFIQGYYDHC